MTTALTHTTGMYELDGTMSDIAKQLAPTSVRIYRNDAKTFADWMIEQGLTPSTFTRSMMLDYRVYLDTTVSKRTGKPYSKNTKHRMFTVATAIMKEQHASGNLQTDVTERVAGFKSGNDETTHLALSKHEARDMLAGIATHTTTGKRDYAILQLLLKTGLRRAELVSLNMGDIKQMDGHTVAVVQHGKGDKLRVVKLRVEVVRAIKAYTKELPDKGDEDSPLFVAIRRGDHPTSRRLTGEAIEDIVRKHAPEFDSTLVASASSKLTPHGLRATFATIALENGAPLEQVQYSLGHRDPRTTERYQKRKLNLDHNAVDVLDF